MADMPDPIGGLDPQQAQNSASSPTAPGITTSAPAPTPPPPMEGVGLPADPVEEAGRLGGPLGASLIGATKAAAEHANGPAMPPPMEGVGLPTGAPPPMEGIGTGEKPPSTWDNIKTAAKDALLTGTGIGNLVDVHNTAGKVADWANQQMQPSAQPMSPFKTLGTGILRDTAELAKGATSPEGLAIAAAQFVPYLNVAVDTGLAIGGIHDMVKGWGDVKNLNDVLDKISNPDFLQGKLNDAANIAGSLAGVSEGAVRLAQISKAKKFGTWKDTQYEDFKNAIPPVRGGDFNEADYQVARAYMDKAHTTGHPIDGSPESVAEALDAKIGENETKVRRVVNANPDVVIPGNPIDAIRQALSNDVSLSFMGDALKSLEDYRLGFQRSGPDLQTGQFDPPLTLKYADDARAKFNAINRDVMKGKNNYDYANMMEVNPGFAARGVAGDVLRDGVYDTLKKLGVVDADQIRLDEGSMIRVRNAALKQIGKEEQVVRASAKPPGKIKKAISKAVKTGGAALGAMGGAATGLPGGAEVGAGLGSLGGGAASEIIENSVPMTREQLIQRAFEKPQQTNPTPVGPPLPVSRNVAPGAAATAGNAATEEQERGPRSPDTEFHHDYHTNNRGEIVHTPQ